MKRILTQWNHSFVTIKLCYKHFVDTREVYLKRAGDFRILQVGLYPEVKSVSLFV